MWDTIFSINTAIAMIGWAILLFAPRRELPMTVVLYLGVALLCLVYSVGLVGIVTGLFDPVGPADAAVDFTTIDGVQTIFASRGGVTVGWTHYLAFDLFAGLWIARDADAKNVSRWIQAPILLATFMAGPLGLLIWLVLRETRRAPRRAD
ncbi:ABA4-like family protein [Erythrobacter litoralis]|uniref:Putative integral membrane protein n=1 Tax=Erythrobacter litoralis (strain HTCC2594) TaxID=314225 RepID=Q2NCM1_ERYLH|nr:ABA4-like family protein [Erythrobacter litoralis]ABC62570.1 Putative integral membrane protein [Erythrobacter litoralis HTCC2594]